MKSIFIIALVFLSFSSKNAYAYLDPATGSIIFQAIFGAGLTLIVFWRNLRNWFKKKIFKTKDKEAAPPDGGDNA